MNEKNVGIGETHGAEKSSKLASTLFFSAFLQIFQAFPPYLKPSGILDHLRETLYR